MILRPQHEAINRTITVIFIHKPSVCRVDCGLPGSPCVSTCATCCRCGERLCRLFAASNRISFFDICPRLRLLAPKPHGHDLGKFRVPWWCICYVHQHFWFFGNTFLVFNNAFGTLVIHLLYTSTLLVLQWHICCAYQCFKFFGVCCFRLFIINSLLLRIIFNFEPAFGGGVKRYRNQLYYYYFFNQRSWFFGNTLVTNISGFGGICY